MFTTNVLCTRNINVYLNNDGNNYETLSQKILQNFYGTQISLGYIHVDTLKYMDGLFVSLLKFPISHQVLGCSNFQNSISNLNMCNTVKNNLY